jgi:hypothetical protein
MQVIYSFVGGVNESANQCLTNVNFIQKLKVRNSKSV